MDVDIVADISRAQVSPLVEFLRDEYYVEEQMIKGAVSRVSSFNLIHLETMMKVDVFIQEKDAYHQSAIVWKLKDRLAEDDHDSVVYLSSPEDIILSKLSWYEQGGRVSERQWIDVLGVIKVKSDSLSTEYLIKWSHNLGVYDLLRQAFAESGVTL